MRTTHHSEYLKLKSVYIKPVDQAFVSNEVLSKQWKELNYLSKPEFANAIEEYKIFENSLKAADRNIHYFSFNEDLSIDSMYCRDAAIATDFGMIICNMGKEGRALEPEAQKKE